MIGTKLQKSALTPNSDIQIENRSTSQKGHTDWHIKKYRTLVGYQVQLRYYHGELYCYRP